MHLSRDQHLSRFFPPPPLKKKKRVVTGKQAVQIITREVRKRMKQDGLIPDRVEPSWQFACGGMSGTVQANTRSEAKSRVKKLLNEKKLPPYLALRRIDEVESDCNGKAEGRPVQG